VCESHPDRPWSKKLAGGCECNAGMPCPECNASDPALRRANLPRLPSDFTIDVDKNGSRH
jgi:hypothetical protein